MRLHLRFKNFKPATIEAAEGLFAARPWRMETEDEKLAAGQAFVDAVSEAYHYPTARVAVRRMWGDSVQYRPAVLEEDSLGSARSISPPMIILDHFSVIGLFHGMRVHLLAHGEQPTSEVDPSAWACSLFYKVRPEMFRARAREGRIVGVFPKDTYTEDTWNRLVMAGVANAERGTLMVSRRDASAVLAGTLTAEDIWAREASEAMDEDEADNAEILDFPAAAAAVVSEAEEVVNGASEAPTEAPEGSEGEATDGLDALNRDALRRLAAENDIPGRGSMLADQLRAALRQAGVRVEG